jgi:predicted tellurium resistance membrane protein TerC
MFESLSEYLIPLLTLTALEIVLGIDNIVFIAILTGKLPEEQQRKARNIGLALAMLMRIALLLAIGWVMKLTTPLFSPLGHPFSGKDLILLVGGLFLVAKATFEIHHKIEHADAPAGSAPKLPFAQAIVQIVLLDIVFSLDSVITAVGMVKNDRGGLYVMITAVIIAVGVMLVFAGPIARFVERHAGLKMLALSFLLLIGVMLIIEGWAGRATPPGEHADHINKNYIYFAMGFSLFVELLNIRFDTKSAKAKAAAQHQKASKVAKL